MRFKKIFGLLAGGLMLFSVAFAGCGAANSNNSGSNNGSSNNSSNSNGSNNNAVNNTDEGITADGIDKENIYTWFDANKTNLPSLENCKKIKTGMSLNQVICELGKPQRDIGSGVSLFQFDLADGSICTITFNQDLQKTENNPDISPYDSLVVSRINYDLGIPEIFFPYSGSLNKLYPWVNKLNVEDIVQVRYEHAYIGVAPGNFKDISYTTNSVDIENSYRLLFGNLQEISPEEGQVDGGGYVKYDFLTADNGTYSVKVSNNRLYLNDRYYKFAGNFYYKFEHADVNCYSFDTNDIPRVEQYEIYTYATESVKVGDYDGLGEFEFCIYDGLLEKAPSYYVKTAFAVKLLILSGNQFMIENDANTAVYQFTGEKDFSSLFEDSNG